MALSFMSLADSPKTTGRDAFSRAFILQVTRGGLSPSLGTRDDRLSAAGISGGDIYLLIKTAVTIL